MRFFLFFIFFVIGIVPIYAKQPEWLRKIKKIEVLKSTKAEVEKLFGNPQIIEVDDLAAKYKNGWGKTVRYDTKYGNLEISYAAGKCSENKGLYSWDIAADIVFELTFSPNDIVLDNQLGYNLGKFEKESDSEAGKTYSLKTGNSGIKIEIEDAKVSSLNFFIVEKYLNQLECKNVKVKEPVWLENLRKLELFKSSRGELEILFENPRILDIHDDSEEGGWGINIKYETIYGELEVEYSSGTCSQTQSKYGYDAVKDTIVEMIFHPIEEVDVTEINFDIRQFKSDPEICIPGAFTRRNHELGVEIYLIDQIVKNIEFYPNEKLRELDCEKVLDLEK